MSKQVAGFFNYLVIVVFAGCIVAIAAAELHKSYRGGDLRSARGGAGRGRPLPELRADAGSPKAGLRKTTPVQSAFESGTSGTKTEERGAGQGKKGRTDSVEQSDNLGWSDRRELNNLIDNLSP